MKKQLAVLCVSLLLGFSGIVVAQEKAAGAAPVAAAPAAGAGMTAGDYDKVQVEAGLFKGNLDGTIDTLSDGAKIVLFSSKDETKRLPISANDIKFVWPEGANPTNMILTGKVVVEHPQVNVHSEKADWDMVKGILTFTGDPIIKTPNGQTVRGQKVVVNMADNTFQVYEVTIPEFQLGGSGFGGATGGASADPSLLKEADVLDFAGLLNSVRKEAAAGPSPGKQVVSLLDATAQKLITTAPVETLLENKASVLKQLNRVLASPRFYSEAAFKSVTVPQETQDALAQKDLAGQKLIGANRSLLEAAYPGLIAPKK